MDRKSPHHETTISEEEVERIFERVWLKGLPILTGSHLPEETQANVRAIIGLMKGDLKPLAELILALPDNPEWNAWRPTLEILRRLIEGENEFGIKINIIKDTAQYPGALKTPSAIVSGINKDARIYLQVEKRRELGATYENAVVAVSEFAGMSTSSVERSYGKIKQGLEQTAPQTDEPQNH